MFRVVVLVVVGKCVVVGGKMGGGIRWRFLGFVVLKRFVPFSVVLFSDPFGKRGLSTGTECFIFLIYSYRLCTSI